MGRIEKTVFISYRRTNFPWALNIYQDLTHHGYDVFFDYQSINSGDFDKVILDNIKARAHFIVVLTPSALDRCKEPEDWLRREIETAIAEKRNIIPLMMEGFDFGSPSVAQALIGELATLRSKNGLPIYAAYFFEGMEKLRNRYLNVSLSDIPLQPLSADAQELTEAQKSAASEAPPVEKEQLTAQEWFERGFIFLDAENFDEAIRCYTEAINLAPQNADVYSSRGAARYLKGDLDGAILDLNEAIRLNPNIPEPYSVRGVVHSAKGEFDEAIQDYSEAINIDPKFEEPYYNRGNAFLFEKENFDAALADYNRVIRLDPNHIEAYLNRGLAHREKQNYDRAIKDFTKAIRLKPEFSKAIFYRGNFYLENNDLKGALADFTEAIRIESGFADAYFKRALVQAAYHDLKSALADLDKVIHLDPSNIDAYSLRAVIWEEKRDFSSAIADYQKYLELGGTQKNDQKEVEEKINKLKSKLTKKKSRSSS